MIITLTNGKGGTGKTTLSIYLAINLCNQGRKVLFIDLDPNCSASEALGKILCENNSKQLLSGRNVNPYILKKSKDGKGQLDLIPSDLDLDMLQNVTDVQLRMQIKKQDFVSKYDHIIIDPPGTWNSQTRNAIFAADFIKIVGKCSPLDFVATQNYFNKLSECCLDADIQVICNSYSKAADPDGILDNYKKTFGDWFFPNPIPKMNSLKRLTKNPDYHIRTDIEEKLAYFVDCCSLAGKTSEVLEVAE